MFYKQVMAEIDTLGLDSLFITIVISIFMGAVTAIQTAANISGPLTPKYLVGFTTAQTMILEFSPTILSLILAGKVGSRIASEIGSMRVTEQIDALDIMGVNSANYLILPKVVASLIINPFLVIISMAVGIFGGWLASLWANLLPVSEYIYGAQIDFRLFIIIYALIKAQVFAIIITTVSSYQGYYTQGGALEVGTASTRAVVQSSIILLLFNLILTELLLT
ncbi:MAG: ABC transporter permease [Bacteroidota bacterium]